MNIKSLPLFILISSSLLNAQVVPGRWEKVDSLPANAQLTITLKSGNEANYIFNSSDSANLAVQSESGTELVIPKADVAKVVRLKPPSNQAAWIGAGVGAAAGAVPIAVAFCSADGCRGEGNIVAATVAVSALGALVGYSIGKALADDSPSEEVVFQAP